MAQITLQVSKPLHNTLKNIAAEISAYSSEAVSLAAKPTTGPESNFSYVGGIQTISIDYLFLSNTSPLTT